MTSAFLPPLKNPYPYIRKGAFLPPRVPRPGDRPGTVGLVQLDCRVPPPDVSPTTWQRHPKAKQRRRAEHVRARARVKELVTSSWSGLCKVWNVESATKGLVLRAHDERITGVTFHPVRAVH
eukprot:1182048-Prorocentrum_minimum.AAC.5